MNSNNPVASRRVYPGGEPPHRRDKPGGSQRALLFLILLCAPLFFFRLGDRDLHSSHEGRAAQNAQYMLARGDWTIPKLFNDRLDLQKPPLFYWLVACFGWLNGGIIDPWVIRLPSAFSALGCLVVLFYLGHRLGRPRTGFFAALILATSLHFTWLARVGRIDMPLTFALTLAVAASLIARQRAREGGNGLGWAALCYVAVSVGALLKGPIAIVLFFLWQVSFRFLGDGRADGYAPRIRSTWWWGYPLVLALVSPWFLWANWKTDNEVWEVFFLYHNLKRGLGGGDSLASYPIWYYLPRLPVDLFPWSCLVPWALWRYWRTEGKRDELARAGILWFAAFFLFFSVMSFKRADYLLPLFPALALFLGSFLDTWFQSRVAPSDVKRQSLRSSRSVSAAAILTCLCWLAYLQWFDSDTRHGWAWQRQALDIRSLTDRPVIFFRTEAHALAFYIGRPLDTILEWENLDIWASERGLIYFVMPPDCADQWSKHLIRGKLVEHARLDLPERPLVILHSAAP